MSTTFIDVTVPVTEEMPQWPDNPDFKLKPVQKVSEGDPATVSLAQMGTHTGTHVDAPSHFFPGSQTVDQLDVSKMVGLCRVIQIEGAKAVTREELKEQNWEGVKRVLFKTHNSDTDWFHKDFNENFIYLDPTAAVFLANQEIELVGIDYLSIDSPEAEESPSHRVLIQNDVCILEGLNLQDVNPGDYELICLPLFLKGSDGAPARAVLKVLE